MANTHLQHFFDKVQTQFGVDISTSIKYAEVCVSKSNDDLLTFILALRDEARVDTIEDAPYAMIVGGWLNSRYDALHAKLGPVRFRKLIKRMDRSERTKPTRKQQELVNGVLVSQINSDGSLEKIRNYKA